MQSSIAVLKQCKKVLGIGVGMNFWGLQELLLWKITARTPFCEKPDKLLLVSERRTL